MALPLIPLAARAALSLARNKKMRDALTKSVSKATKAFKKPKTANIAKATKAKFPKPSSPKNIATKNFAAGAVLGAGTGEAARITSKKIDELKRNKPKKTGKAYKIR